MMEIRMLAYLYHTLCSFRPLFSRHRTWLLFCLIILGFIGSHTTDGISSFCRFWGLQNPGYLSLLQFFRSDGWSLQRLTLCWQLWALKHAQPVEVKERLVLLGDHTTTPKDGRHMPGVVTLHQDSETQTKPTYFRGHFWAFLGVLNGTPEQPFCCPLQAEIHQGLIHIGEGEPEPNKEKKMTLARRFALMALSFALTHSKPCILVLDAFFSVTSVFEVASYVWRHQVPWLTILVRAKKNYVAYHPAEPKEEKGPGRPRKYGEKVKLYDLFEQPELFEQEEALIYGKREKVSYCVVNLFWRPFGQMLRFVLVQSSHGKMVLMCNDLTFCPITAIETYCLRMRIEVMFAMLKQVIGAFSYHFWTRGLPRHSRRPKKNSSLSSPKGEELERVQATWLCYESFVMMGCIALGLLQVVSLRFGKEVWAKYTSFLRTKSRELPSERTVKSVVAQELVSDMHKVACSKTMQELRDAYIPFDKDTFQEPRVAA
jgi:hypothetical protein